ncbi:hypothetical protein NZD89_21310 [Alicyclobacillus fastidiosus]|uniref:Uncharacterized protein n=1 Tax=Alicyclobacillus fastidiosus TaxID=392011 RepID=A0ABY6ZD80_9BACL|nr:hypothetical protein [Alicyclobacillus fastidiosus]WAH40809.1 hypothetical protein NZD89_21310 [Alicyclobacillus fastidiosus]
MAIGFIITVMLLALVLGLLAKQALSTDQRAFPHPPAEPALHFAMQRTAVSEPTNACDSEHAASADEFHAG